MVLDHVSDPGSFRDPSGRIYFRDGRVFRTVMPCAAKDFEFTEASGIIQTLEANQQLVASNIVDADLLGEQAVGASFLLEHPRLPFIAHPYEWSFPTLRAAALAHLDIHHML